MPTEDLPNRTEVRPDPFDLRDRIYAPSLKVLPSTYGNDALKSPNAKTRIKHQGNTNACTGFALSAMVERLLDPHLNAPPHPLAVKDLGWISPFMPYFFARRYDEFDTEADVGSSARAAMKAWHKHGIASCEKWQTLNRPNAHDWIAEAFERPLGAYYRVDHTSIPDAHSALTETGVLYATAATHPGWEKPGKNDGKIIFNPSVASEGGHAFLIVGYDQDGFWIQNSWGTDWGLSGYAHLSYADWSKNGWDLWVAQIGVRVSGFLGSVSQGMQFAGENQPTNRLLSSVEAIAAQQLSPFIVNLERDGLLSNSGSFATSEADLGDLVSHYIPSAIESFKLTQKDPIDIAIYAHGGLTNEKGAAETAKLWIPEMFNRRIFPLFIMWETGLFDILGEWVRKLLPEPKIAAGLGSWWDNFRDERLESAVSGIGTRFWNEMKDNSLQATANSDGGLQKLYRILVQKEGLRHRLRIHLIGHSAGACFHTGLLPALVGADFHVDGLYLMAPAVRVDVFEQEVLPHFQSGKVACYTQFHLSDKDELDDLCPLPNTSIGYHKSLLYLVSNAFERQRGTPILGMEKFASLLGSRPPKALTWDFITSRSTALSPNASNASTHGGFGSDVATLESILARITARASKPLSPAAAQAPQSRPRKKRTSRKANR